MPVDSGLTSSKREDLSRETFDRRNAYRAVVAQQGRVRTDAEENEQRAIDLYRADTTFTDVIGIAGYPKGTTGFAIGASAGKVTIGAGRIYLDGILVENFDACTLDTQPFQPVTGAIANGDYVAVLEAWERDRTFVDDPALRESALGGPDTTARAQIVWRVRLVAPGTTFTEAPRPKLTVRTDPGGPPKPCALPPNAGYFGLENQLFRIEIHSGGAPGASTFTWSRENASVVAGIVKPGSGSTLIGTTFQVTTLGPDGPLGFAGQQWVELVDDNIERSGKPGPLVQILRVDPPNTIVLHAAPGVAVDSAKRAKMRRWDQTGAGATLNGIGILDTTTWITIENGIQIKFDATAALPGDYWLIPARTAVDPNGDSLGVPMGTGIPARRVPVHRALLSKVHVAGGNVTIPAGGDLRLPFPPLTAIAASDVSYIPGCPDLAGCKTVQEALDKLCGASGGPCTLVVKPGANWDAPLRDIIAKKMPRDLEICFETGTFDLNAELAFQDFDNVKVTGAGAGTLLRSHVPEIALRFARCKTVDLRDVTVRGGPAARPGFGTVKGDADDPGDAGGAVTCSACNDVRIERVWLFCADGTERTSACLTVIGAASNDPAAGAGIVRVRDASLSVGNQQIGILLVGIADAMIEDNVIIAPSAALQANMNDPRTRAAFRRLFVRDASFKRQKQTMTKAVAMELAAPPEGGAPAAPAAPGAQPQAAMQAQPAAQMAKAARHVTVPVGKTNIDVGGSATMAGVWKTLVNERGTAIDTYRQMIDLANKFVIDPNARRGFAAVGQVFNDAVGANRTCGGRGIVVAGRGFSRVRIEGNIVENFTQGIIAGVSHREPKPQTPDPDIAGTVEIVSNRIAISTTTLTAFRARHAIFVGNVRRCLVARNEAAHDNPPIRHNAADAIRVWGYDGDYLIVRENRVENFPQAIVVQQLHSGLHAIPDSNNRIWRATDNLAVNSAPVDTYVLPNWVSIDNLPVQLKI